MAVRFAITDGHWMAAFVVVRFRNDAQIPYDTSTEGITIPAYKKIVLPFSQNYVKPKQIQATGGCVFSLDDDEVEELFLAGGQDQNDVIYRYEDGNFKDITSEIGYTRDDMSEATMSATSLDVDHDGDDDLIVTRKNSIWLYTNDGGKLSGQKLDATMTEETTPISIAVCRSEWRWPLRHVRLRIHQERVDRGLQHLQ